MAQSVPAVFKHGQQVRLDYTPSGADVASGDIVNMGQGLIGYCTSPEGIEDGVLGSLDIGGLNGVYSVLKDGTSGPVFAVGDTVAFDFALELAVRPEDASADHALGVCVKAAGTNEDTVWVLPMPGMNQALQPVAAEALALLTDNSGGAAADGTIAAVAAPTDTPASADALRDDIAANMVPAINAAVKELATKINAIIAVLQQ